MARSYRDLGGLLLLIAGYACVPVLRPPVPRVQLANGHATIAVQNNLPESMSIYAVNASRYTWRIGTVSALGKGVYPVPTAILTEQGAVQLIARPVGPGDQLAFGRVSIVPGARVELVLDEPLRGGGVRVR